tara:strand:- start:137 stop:697 length:561 start_codon:yes stop_codon:yes gene_type:complete
MDEYSPDQYIGEPKYNFGSQDSSQLIQYLDPNTQKQKLLIQLFGLEWDEKKQTWIEGKERSAIVQSQMGRHWVENIITPYFTVSATTNRLKKNEIVLLIDNLIDDMAATFRSRSKRNAYGIDLKDVTDVGNLIWRSCATNLLRSNERGIDVMLLNQNTKFIESKNTVSSKKDGGFLSKLNPMNSLK